MLRLLFTQNIAILKTGKDWACYSSLEIFYFIQAIEQGIKKGLSETSGFCCTSRATAKLSKFIQQKVN